jgi:hypothetical protein
MVLPDGADWSDGTITELLLATFSGIRRPRPMRDHRDSKPLTTCFQGWIHMRMKRSSIAITAALGLAIAGGSAFTAANTGTPLASAGFGQEDTDGFDVTAVKYQFGVNDDHTAGTGDDIDEVQFTLTPNGPAGSLAASQVRVRLVKADDYITNCSVTSGTVGTAGGTAATTWSCVTGGVNTLDIDTLDIVAVSQAYVTAPV